MWFRSRVEFLMMDVGHCVYRCDVVWNTYQVLEKGQGRMRYRVHC